MATIDSYQAAVLHAKERAIKLALQRLEADPTNDRLLTALLRLPLPTPPPARAPQPSEGSAHHQTTSAPSPAIHPPPDQSVSPPPAPLPRLAAPAAPTAPHAHPRLNRAQRRALQARLRAAPPAIANTS